MYRSEIEKEFIENRDRMIKQILTEFDTRSEGLYNLLRADLERVELKEIHPTALRRSIILTFFREFVERFDITADDIIMTIPHEVLETLREILRDI